VGNFTIQSSPTSGTQDEKPGCGCGASAGLAFIPPIGFKIRRLIKKKKA
jgi:hypothetical protein